MSVSRALEAVEEDLQAAREQLRNAQADVDALEAAEAALNGGAAPESLPAPKATAPPTGAASRPVLVR